MNNHKLMLSNYLYNMYTTDKQVVLKSSQKAVEKIPCVNLL